MALLNHPASTFPSYQTFTSTSNTSSGDIHPTLSNKNSASKLSEQIAPITSYPTQIEDVGTVGWDGDLDPENPHNWSLPTKLTCTAQACAMVFVVALSSSIFGPSAHVTAQQFGVADDTMHLGVALFVAGFAVGPLFFAPLSEVVGHMIPLCVGLAGVAIFQIPFALAEDVKTMLISRFLCGVIGSGAMAVGSGMLAELWGPATRAVAIGLSGMFMNIGSTIGPIAGVYILERYGWRWTGWATLLVCIVVGFSAIFNLRETSSKKILIQKARRLRRETGNESMHTNSEKAGLSFQLLMRKHLTQPPRIFMMEPILIILTIYLILVYGTLYLSYQMFSFAFLKRGWPHTTASLPFLAVALGLITAWIIFSVFTMTWYQSRFKQRGTVLPEDRLPTMILGAVILPPALTWFGWSMRTNAAPQILACFFIGMALQLIFMSGIVYIVDVYIACSNSAISIHVVVRSIVSATFPLWAGPMYENLGIEWSSTVLAGFSAIMLASPILFSVYGAKIRSWSRFSI
ncbi:hypothetical protein AWENTII_012057 [Aspergillus wentii]